MNIRGEAAHFVWLEWVLGGAVLVLGLLLAYSTYVNGYFPQPFFYDANDTWGDWFATAVWSRERGAYSIWLSIYPPLSFVILKFLSLPYCYAYADMHVARSCDWLGVATIHGLYVLNIFLTSKVFLKLDRATALPRAFALNAGMPMLFGLERGNLVLLCFTCVVLGWGPLLKSARLRWLFVGLGVNLKVYLVAGVAALLLRRRWLWVEGCAASIVLVWVASYAILGEGTPFEVYRNIVNWATNASPSALTDFWYSNTYVPLRYLLTESNAPVNLFLSSQQIEAAVLAIDVSVRLTQGLILIAAAATWLRPEVVSPHRAVFLGLALAMVTSETSPYTQPILFFFVFMERWQGWLRPLAISVCYLLCLPGEIRIGGDLNLIQYSFISGKYVVTSQGLGLSMLIRPLIFMLPAIFLALHTIVEVVRHYEKEMGGMLAGRGVKPDTNGGG